MPDYEVWNLQYATLTDKAAADFATIPGLAESWEASNGGKTYTYTLRDGLEWSDGTPLTAEDVAYTINRAREEEWLNYTSTVANLTAKAIDDRTVEITSSVTDPKLPTMDVYILPKHIWEKHDAKAITKYDGAGRRRLGPVHARSSSKRGQFVRLKANPTATGAASRPSTRSSSGSSTTPTRWSRRSRRARSTPRTTSRPQSFERLEDDRRDRRRPGQAGRLRRDRDQRRRRASKKPHPALLDLAFAPAIAHAIDKQTLIDRVYAGIGTARHDGQPVAEPGVDPRDPGGRAVRLRPRQGEADPRRRPGYKDTNGDGIREMPGGGDAARRRLRACAPSRRSAPGDAEFVTGWLKEIGIGTKLQTVDDADS